jgi:hypothetical protein
MNEIERAERIQAWKAFLIPSTLFVACLLNAAGIYILYTGNTLGIVFLGMGFTVIIGGLFAFITFQNRRRAGGQWKKLPPEQPVVSPADFAEAENDATEQPQAANIG